MRTTIFIVVSSFGNTKSLAISMTPKTTLFPQNANEH